MDQLCIKRVLMHRKMALQRVFRIAAKTDPADHDVAVFDLRIVDRAGREAFRRNGRAGQSPSGGRIHRIGKLSDGTVQEASGVLFGVRCMDPASAHLAPPLFLPGYSRTSSLAIAAAQEERPGATSALRASEPRRALPSGYNSGPASMHWRGSSNRPESPMSTKFCGRTPSTLYM